MALRTTVQPRTAQRGRSLLLAVLLLFTVAGPVAWWFVADPGAAPFLPREAAAARRAVNQAFPDAEATNVRVVFLDTAGGNVLTPEALTALVALRTRITGDSLVAATLATDQAIGSPLVVLGTHLEGQPGEWDRTIVGRALANATATEEGRRQLTTYLGNDAVVDASLTRASSMAVVVRLDRAAPVDQLIAAQEAIRAIADRTRISGLDVVTDAPSMRAEALRSWGTWTTYGLTLVMAAAVLVLCTRSLTTAALGTLVAAGSHGAGLLIGALIGHATALAPVAAILAATMGLAAALPGHTRPATRWLPALIALPFLAALWAGAGQGALAAICGSAAATSALAASVLFAPSRLARADNAPGHDAPWSMRGHPLIVPVLAGLLLVGLIASAGLADDARGGWRGALPTTDAGGHAAHMVEENFEAGGPGSELVVVAWGAVTHPAFLDALHDTTTRLDGLPLAAAGGGPRTILELAEEWATEDPAAGGTDVYDPDFAQAWANATKGGATPTGDARELFEALRRLDPAGVATLLSVAGPDEPADRGAALLRQRVVLGSDVAPPGPAITRALDPLVLASDEVTVAGGALDDDQARNSLLVDQAIVLAVILVAGLVATLAWAGREALWADLASIVALASLLAGAGAASIFAMAGGHAGPLTSLVPAVAVGLVLTTGIRLVRAASDAYEASAEAGRAVSSAMATVRFETLGAFALVGACTAATLVAPAPAIGHVGLALLAALASAALVVQFVLPGALVEWLRVPRAGLVPDEGPMVHAHLDCPVCRRSTATAAARCTSCGEWNVVEACPAHLDAMPGRCSACDGQLNTPHFA